MNLEKKKNKPKTAYKSLPKKKNENHKNPYSNKPCQNSKKHKTKYLKASQTNKIKINGKGRIDCPQCLFLLRKGYPMKFCECHD